jgi:hypothetical protein
MSSFINTKYAQKNLSENTNINDWEEEFKKVLFPIFELQQKHCNAMVSLNLGKDRGIYLQYVK